MAEKIKLYFDRVDTCQIKGYPAPLLVLKADNGFEAYMMPFRCYRIQICATPEGVTDLGATGVIGLANVADMAKNYRKFGYGYQSNFDSRGIAEELVIGLGSSALLKFLTNSYGKDFEYRGSFRDRELMEEWASKVIDYVDQQVHQ